MSWYQKALDLEPRNPALWAQFAAAKAAQGDLHSAENASRQALSIAPRFVAARVQLVAILREARKFDQALQELDHLEAVAPGHKDLAAERSALIAARNARSQDAQDPKRVHLGRILVSDEAKAKQAEARLGQGDAFADVARALGEGPEARLGGDIGHVDPAELRPELAAAISQLQPGMTSEVLRLGDQFLILQRIP